MLEHLPLCIKLISLLSLCYVLFLLHLLTSSVASYHLAKSLCAVSEKAHWEGRIIQPVTAYIEWRAPPLDWLPVFYLKNLPYKVQWQSCCEVKDRTCVVPSSANTYKEFNSLYAKEFVPKINLGGGERHVPQITPPFLCVCVELFSLPLLSSLLFTSVQDHVMLSGGLHCCPDSWILGITL